MHSMGVTNCVIIKTLKMSVNHEKLQKFAEIG